jgi:uncharacterized protein (TIGR03435 family)
MLVPKTVIALVTIAVCFAQDPPSFEVASIKPNHEGSLAGFSEDISPNGVFNVRNFSLWNLLRLAYGLRDLQISGAPAWSKAQGFDIQARPAPNGGTIAREQVLRMLQRLLEERFQLKAHRESRDTPAYTLTVSRGGPKLSAVREGAQRGRLGDLDMPSMTMESLCQTLEFELGRPVVDRTGLPGSFAIRLQWASDKAPAPDPSRPSLFTAVQEQLGLKLDATRAPIELFVIDGIQQPSEN